MVNLDTCQSIPGAFFEMARTSPDRPVYSEALAEEGADAAPRRKRSRTYREVASRIKKLAAYLRSVGVRKGEAVAIVSQTRPEWMEADIAIMAAGGISVAVYPSLTAQEIGYILFDSGAKYVIVENQEQLEKMLHLAANPCHIQATEERPASEARLEFRRIITFERTKMDGVVVALEDIIGGSAAEDSEVYETIGRQDLASLVYTSGTTGPPKGVMQTHGNHLSNVRQARDTQLFVDDSCLSLFLPLAHAFAKLMGYIGFLTPATVEFPAVLDRMSSKVNLDSFARDMREGDADIVPGVPRLYEKMHDGVRAKAHGTSVQAKLLSMTLWAAEAVFQAKKAGRSAPLGAAAVYGLTGALRKKVKRALFGPHFRFAISGGAKLQPATNEFFDALGIELLEGYGLTETVVATNINRLGRKRIGTVGPVLSPDIEVKIAEDGEIMFRGPNVSPGYYNRALATEQAWDNEGWFRTGDLGSVGEDGYLSIQGRKKELIVTAGGKKIPPDGIEQKLKLIPMVSQAMLFGDEKPYCIALLTLNTDAAHAWARKEGVEILGEPADDERIHKFVMGEISKINQNLASYESIKRVRLLPGEFTIENGLLTPTLKVKRREVVKKYRSEIDGLYASTEGTR